MLFTSDIRYYLQAVQALTVDDCTELIITIKLTRPCVYHIMNHALLPYVNQYDAVYHNKKYKNIGLT